MASLGRQSEKRAAIEAAVLRATEELLSEGASFAELNIEKIATGAGISRTAFYFYFRDKRELLVRLTTDVNEQLMTAADTWWSGGDIRGALVSIASLYREHAPLFRATVEVSTYDEEVATFWRGLVGRFVDATEQRIRSEQSSGAALPGDPRAVSFALIWMVERSMYQQYVQSEPASTDELVDALTTIFERTVYGATA